MIPVEYYNLYGDLEEGFKYIQDERSQLQSQWDEWKSEGMSEEELNECIGADQYNTEKDFFRSIMWILDQHLESLKLKKDVRLELEEKKNVTQ